MTTKPRNSSRPLTVSLVASAFMVLAGCAGTVEKLAQVGSEPPLTSIQNPVAVTGYQPVSLPMPTQVMELPASNSLWRQGTRAFFKDQRASTVGDILTVTIDISDNATLSNSTNRSRVAAENASATLLGYEASLGQILPESLDPSNLVDLDSNGSTTGTGSITRSESLTVQVAATVIQILPNGNLVIAGRQEVRVNFEVRELQITGVIRPQDIESTNQISYEKIAEARISYGGRGHLTDVQQPRYGQQIYDIIWPF
ncbi:MAG: flagellar basal body L-ring protein FlgH [Alphaproteobacteria bacterium]